MLQRIQSIFLLITSTAFFLLVNSTTCWNLASPASSTSLVVVVVVRGPKDSWILFTECTARRRGSSLVAPPPPPPLRPSRRPWSSVVSHLPYRWAERGGGGRPRPRDSHQSSSCDRHQGQAASHRRRISASACLHPLTPTPAYCHLEPAARTFSIRPHPNTRFGLVADMLGPVVSRACCWLEPW